MLSQWASDDTQEPKRTSCFTMCVPVSTLVHYGCFVLIRRLFTATAYIALSTSITSIHHSINWYQAAHEHALKFTHQNAHFDTNEAPESGLGCRFILSRSRFIFFSATESRFKLAVKSILYICYASYLKIKTHKHTVTNRSNS